MRRLRLRDMCDIDGGPTDAKFELPPEWRGRDPAALRELPDRPVDAGRLCAGEAV